MRRAFPLGAVIALAALAGAARLAFTWLPNVSPAFFVVFVAGVALGPLAGAAVGALAMTVTNLLLSGVHPAMLVNVPAMALLGASGGALGAVVNLGQRREAPRFFTAVLAGAIGFFAVLLFSLASDAFTYLLFFRSGVNALLALVAAGLLFNAIPAALSGALFALATRPVLDALRHAGLIENAPARPRGTGRSRGSPRAPPQAP